MSLDKREGDSKPTHADFAGCDEYDIVTSNDLLELNKHFPTNRSSRCGTPNAETSFVQQYEEEWKELYIFEQVDIESLKQKSISGKLRTSSFRSICWRCLLGILHKQPRQWLCQLRTYRKHYNEICLQLENNPWKLEKTNLNDNPLSQESESIWQKYFCDKELKSVIQQDVNRTFPDIDFFRREDIQQIMIRILFCYARQNPWLCYRQGMHEILAPLIFILHCDHQALLQAKEQNFIADNHISEIFKPECLEQDAYSMFKFIMNHIESSYKINNILSTSSGQNSIKFQDEYKYHENEVNERLESIRKKILQQIDPELNTYLEKLDIPLHLFGIRWLRLLFGREFPLQDLLVLWDFIFAYNFETVNYIVVAMLTTIREILLRSDYTTCLSNLMNYPNEVDVKYVIDSALHIQDPQKNSAPDVVRLPIVKLERTYKNSIGHSRKNNKGCKINNFKPLKEFNEKYKPHFFEQTEENEIVVSDNVIDNPNILKSELEQARLVMSIAQHKLLQFHSSLKKNLRNDNISAEVQLVLDGIFELSSLLKNHCNYEVETACEAGEGKDKKTSDETTNFPKSKQSVSINCEKKCHTLPKTRRNLRSGELTVFKYCIGSTINSTLKTDPLHLIKNIKEGEH